MNLNVTSLFFATHPDCSFAGVLKTCSPLDDSKDARFRGPGILQFCREARLRLMAESWRLAL